jgi:hypothetical protein
MAPRRLRPSVPRKQGRCQACRHTPVIPALGRVMQEDHEFEVSLGYTMRSVSEIKQNKQVRMARCWWLRPVILATQEADIRRIAI